MDRGLFLIVEGRDDERFFSKILVPIFKKAYRYVRIWQHAQRSKHDEEKLFLSLNQMDTDYIYVEDIDDIESVNKKLQLIQNKLDNLDIGKAVIVVTEIESWYLAGLDQKSSSELGLPKLHKTDDIYKEKFYNMIPSGYGSRIDFMQEMLKHYSVDVAREKNDSFRYFYDEFVEPTLSSTQ